MKSREEQFIRLLTCPTNRGILTALNDAARSFTTTELAARLESSHASVFDFPDDEGAFERILIGLHHHHLPELDEAGLVAYDRDANRVTLEDYDAVDPEWFDIDLFDEFLSRVRPGGATGMDTVGVLEGQEAVIEHAQRLIDESERELFFVFDVPDLLNRGCFPLVRDAIDRGVAVAFGSRNAELQTTMREEFPEMTIWEPQLDWMAPASRNPKIARLVVADRKMVLVTISNDEGANGEKTEVGMLGEGQENPLVVLVRELLGPRLDHLDYQSEDFRSDLPF